MKKAKSYPYQDNPSVWGLPGGAVVKNLPANTGDARDTGSIPGSGRSPGVGNGNPHHYSCLGNFMDKGSWWTTVHGVAKSQTQLSAAAHTWCIGRFQHFVVVVDGCSAVRCNSCVLLKGVQIGTVTMENSMEVSYKIKTELPYGPAIPFLGI